MTAPAQAAGPCTAEAADMVKRLLKLDEGSAVSTNHKGPHAIYGHAAALLESLQRERDALQARVAELLKFEDYTAKTLTDRAEKAEAELAAARKDAERYRWFKEHSDHWQHYVGDWQKVGIDAAIDAALAAKGEK